MKQKLAARPSVSWSRGLPIAAMAGLLAMAGCSGGVQNATTYQPAGGQPLPAPNEVLVYPFTVDPNTVKLDSGMKLMLDQMDNSPDPQAQKQQLANEVIGAISETLVDSINQMGMNAVAVSPATPPAIGDVVVQGQITEVNAGNANKRTVIGFGAGKSDVLADVQLLRVGPGGVTQPLETFNAGANSGRTPGLALGAAGAAAGHVAMAAAGAAAGTVTRSRSGLAKDGENMAKKAAASIKKYFVSQGWIAAN